MSDIFEFELVSPYEKPRHIVVSRGELEERLGGILKMVREGYWKLRIYRGNRSLWLFLAFFCWGAIGFSFIDIPKVTVPETFVTIFRLFFGLLSLLFLYFYKNSDSYIVIDKNNGKLLRITKFFSKEHTDELANFSDILGIVTANIEHELYKFYLERAKKSGKRAVVPKGFSPHLVYLEAVLHNGKKIWLSGLYNNFRKKDLEKIELLGRALSQLLGVKSFYPYQKGQMYCFGVATDKTGKNTLQIELVKLPFYLRKVISEKMSIAIVLFTVVFFFVILPLILVYIFH